MSSQHNTAIIKFFGTDLSLEFLNIQQGSHVVPLKHDFYINVIAQRLVEAKLLGGSGSPTSLPAVTKRVKALSDIILYFEEPKIKIGQVYTAESKEATRVSILTKNVHYQFACSIQAEAEKGLLDVGQTIATIDAIFDLMFHIY
jgi:hypothetical protein